MDAAPIGVRAHDMKLRVVGLGAVGSRVAVNALERGHAVTGVDVSAARLSSIRSGLDSETVAALAAFLGRTFTLAERPEPGGAFDATLVCVPTWSEAASDYDDSRVTAVMEALGPCLSRGELISIESTVQPHTTRTAVRESLERGSGMRVGEDVFLVCSPERVDTTMSETIGSIPKVVGGVTAACTNRGVAVYAELVDRVVPVADSSVAEASKVLENVYRFVNIAFVNEAAEVFDRLRIPAHDVIRAASTKPFGFMPFWPSVGIGGECVPLAARLFARLADRAHADGGVAATALASEAQSPARVLRLIEDRHEARAGARILILGLAYKSHATTVTASPGVVLARYLMERGYEVDVLDPNVEHASAPAGIGNVVSEAALRAHYDVVVLAAWHETFRPLLGRLDGAKLVDLAGSCTSALQHVPPLVSEAYAMTREGPRSTAL